MECVMDDDHPIVRVLACDSVRRCDGCRLSTQLAGSRVALLLVSLREARCFEESHAGSVTRPAPGAPSALPHACVAPLERGAAIRRYRGANESAHSAVCCVGCRLSLCETSGLGFPTERIVPGTRG
eukprot:6887067-Prymnesium_polylepis.1